MKLEKKHYMLLVLVIAILIFWYFYKNKPAPKDRVTGNAIMTAP